MSNLVWNLDSIYKIFEQLFPYIHACACMAFVHYFTMHGMKSKHHFGITLEAGITIMSCEPMIIKIGLNCKLGAYPKE